MTLLFITKYPFPKKCHDYLAAIYHKMSHFRNVKIIFYCHLLQNVKFPKLLRSSSLLFKKITFSSSSYRHLYKKTSLLPNRHGHPTVTNYCHLLENLKVIPALFITKCQSPHSDLLESVIFSKLSRSSYCDEWAAAYRLSTV